ncbi:MAG TPA: hypothetical protein EYP56_00235 [Planctomycetaceae bacterium]|nr:hypothetical protein [Planctomycetaceae bacterium]HIQ23271.1 hypothetical protein [Planctomycetota bacterium]
MRLWARILLIVVVLAVGASVLYRGPKLARQWAAFQVGTAISFDQARRELARLERRPDAELQIDALVAKWGTGNPRYDLFLARYLSEPQCTGSLRARFSLELAWREGLLARWAHFWCWYSDSEPDRRIAQIAEYLTVLLDDPVRRPITWREVLELQAVFQLTGHPELAVRLKPDGWRRRFRRWQSACAGRLPHITRPEKPLPDWQGPLPP